ncbi:UNKNOWN [Stylonychia lemnae]|uniref:Uncharacterized protein n=1 Tax=Stylonychia lemnae TaxID=5949 RepID=A0A078AEN3_STYLE|nr:UNKNOWN [Stylonychia lemnae]|eukprot:CDW79937.1 UNKNOWN [Stylonychia lemnae]
MRSFIIGFEKLNECKYGSYFSGQFCHYDIFNAVKVTNEQSPLLMKVNQSMPLQDYSIGFWFKLQILQDQNILCGATPQDSNFLYLKAQTTLPTLQRQLELRQNNCLFVLTNNYDVDLQPRIWYQIGVSVKNAQLPQREHFAAITDYSAKHFIGSVQKNQITCPSFTMVNNEPDAEVYLCKDNNFGNTGLSVKYLYFLSDYAITANDMFTTTRVVWKMMGLKPALYLTFNNTQGKIWTYDLANDQNIVTLRSQISQQSLYWVHEQFGPKMCHDYYEILDLDRMICIRKYFLE